MWLSHCLTYVHHSLFNYIRQQNEKALITLKLLDVTSRVEEGVGGTRERERWPRALIFCTIDMSYHRRLNTPRHSNLLPSTALILLKALLICCSTRPSWYNWPHQAPPTPTLMHTHTCTNRKHTHTRTNIRFSFLPVCGWNDYWRLGLYLKCAGTEKKMRCRWWRWQLG